MSSSSNECKYCYLPHEDDLREGYNNPTLVECPYCHNDALHFKHPAFFTVAVYLEQLAYGGPEEGGWHYNTFELSWYQHHMKLVKIFTIISDDDEDKNKTAKNAAKEYAREVQKILDETEECNKIPLSSVNSNGRLVALVENEFPNSHYPTVRPHYE